MPAGEADHGKDFGIKIGTVTLTAFTKTGQWEVESGIHDMSGGGTVNQRFRGGQIKRSLTIGGWTDDSTTLGPRYLETITGTTVAFERYPSGIGTGKRKQTGNVVIGKWVETSKNDDIFQWTCDLTVDGAVVEGTQT